MSTFFNESSTMILGELRESLAHVHDEQVERMLDAICNARRVFVVGAGRMGIMLGSFCMRLNHLGFTSYVTGAIDCPPIGPGDLLLVASSSGETPTVREIVRKADAQNAIIVAITACPESTIARTAAFTVQIEAPSSLVASLHAVTDSRQPMKTLFEQTLFVLLEASVLLLMKRTGQTASDMARRHGNLE